MMRLERLVGIGETKTPQRPSKYLGKLEIAAGEWNLGRANDRPGSTYVLNSVSLC